MMDRLRTIADEADRLALDMRALRDAAPAREKPRYRYPLRIVEQAAALLKGIKL